MNISLLLGQKGSFRVAGNLRQNRGLSYSQNRDKVQFRLAVNKAADLNPLQISDKICITRMVLTLYVIQIITISDNIK